MHFTHLVTSDTPQSRCATAPVTPLARRTSVKDAQGDLVQGRTKWRRFAVVVLPAAAAAGAMMVGMANGAIAAQFSVSGQTFKVAADRLEGDGFTQYGGLASEAGANKENPADPKNHPIAVSGIKSADLYGLCQSVKVPGLPVSLVINAGGNGDPAKATDLLIGMDDLKGNATFTNINIGQDASTMDKGGVNLPRGQAGAFGQQADHVTITNLKQTARSTQAATFQLTGLHMYVDVSATGTPKECF
ncbi:DUF6230 family protein [Planosporangium sp. 12N6]|uniref:DUF6230 family protein n=1 Tax=Planosporangium spinosum TaxID=3402278 RepID=UPI003CF70EA0